jgi:hypothetical protein
MTRKKKAPNAVIARPGPSTFSFRSPEGERMLVAGAGFEPATFGL